MVLNEMKKRKKKEEKRNLSMSLFSTHLFGLAHIQVTAKSRLTSDPRRHPTPDEDDCRFYRTSEWAECDALSLCPQELACRVTGGEDGTLWPGHGTYHANSPHKHFTRRLIRHRVHDG